MTNVRGNVLPTALVELLATGRWGPGTRPAHLLAPTAAVGGDLVDVLDLLDLALMHGNTDALVAAYERGEGDALGLTRGAAAHGRLDVDHAVLIAASREQDALALDYSRPGAPRVVATDDGPAGVRWVEVAPTFESLLTTPERDRG
ncbi:hypothetical protein [Cellulomonas sp.]|uniref:hypothetical protein n=1 Tax=Cellulomonas sp. TaxID=40001 RepID=UPI003BAD90F7